MSLLVIIAFLGPIRRLLRGKAEGICIATIAERRLILMIKP